MPEHINIITRDQIPLKAEVWGPVKQSTLIINPAIGVKRKLYHEFAAFLVEQGISVVLYNYRGMEDGIKALPSDVQCDAEAWGRLDQSAIIDWVKNELEPQKLLTLGHSIGGQLLGFAENFTEIDGLIHVASQKGDYRLWPFKGRLKLMMLWHVLIPLMSRGQQFNAKKLSLGTYPWPASAAKQWASWGQQKDYLFNAKFGFDLSPWHQYNKPLLSLGFSDDDMAPPAAIDGLLAEFGSCVGSSVHDNKHIVNRIIDPKSLNLDGIGHFGFFKPKTKQLWQDTVIWIQQLQTK